MQICAKQPMFSSQLNMWTQQTLFSVICSTVMWFSSNQHKLQGYQTTIGECKWKNESLWKSSVWLPLWGQGGGRVVSQCKNRSVFYHWTVINLQLHCHFFFRQLSSHVIMTLFIACLSAWLESWLEMVCAPFFFQPVEQISLKLKFSSNSTLTLFELSLGVFFSQFSFP